MDAMTYKTLADSFEVRHRDDESQFFCVKDGTDEAVHDLIHNIHDEYNLFPNNWLYRVIAEMAENLDYTDGDIGAAADQTVPIATYELFIWLTEFVHARSYVDDVLAERGGSDIDSVVAAAMYNALCEIGGHIVAFIEEQDND